MPKNVDQFYIVSCCINWAKTYRIWVLSCFALYAGGRRGKQDGGRKEGGDQEARRREGDQEARRRDGDLETRRRDGDTATRRREGGGMNYNNQQEFPDLPREALPSREHVDHRYVTSIM